MKAFLLQMWIQFKMDVREKGTLLNFYLVPLVFFFVMGSVFSSINPLMKTTLAASMTIFAVTMGAVMGAPTPLVRMRETGALRAFRVHGIPGIAVLSIQLISAFLHLLIVSFIIYVVAPLAFHATIPSVPALYFAILVAFLLASIGLGLFIGVLARSQSFATMLSMIVFLPTVLLSGIMFPASMLPSSLMWVGRVLPGTHALQSFYGLAYHAKTDINAGLSLCVLVGMAVLIFTVALIVFNRGQIREQA